jgi:hypothetical protein
MRTLLTVVAFLLAAGAAATTTYKWVDKNGVTHYSDRPAPGAEKIEVQEAQTFQAPRPATRATTQRTTGNPNVSLAAYDKLDLWKPENDETLQNIGTMLDVRLRLEPELQPGHAIWLYLDSKRVDGLPQSGEAFAVPNVFRGTHTLHAIVADPDGKPLARSQTITFHVQQSSLNSPQRQPPPAQPRPRPTPGGRPGG